jgi:tetratricopeptide (TPR) repeat protein
VSLGIETLPTRRLLYQLALLAGDQPTATAHFDWARDRPREFDMIGARAQASAWSGQVSEARMLYRQACRLAESRQLPDVGTSYLAWATWMELAFGNLDRAREAAREVLDRRPSYDPALRAALALALAGAEDEAEAITLDLTRTNPNHTLINAVLAPIVRAGIALARRQPAEAIAALDAAADTELGLIAALAPLYLRAQAYLAAGSGQRAVGEFQRLLDHRGSDPFSPFHAVASVGLGRAYALSGNLPASQEAYATFLTAWSHADPDLPILLDARAAHCRI